MVDAVEVLNGCCSEEENRFALQVARSLNLAEVAGSDSHSVDSVGCVCTVLEAPALTERALIDAIKASRCRAGRGLLHDGLTLFDFPSDRRPRCAAPGHRLENERHPSGLAQPAGDGLRPAVVRAGDGYDKMAVLDGSPMAETDGRLELIENISSLAGATSDLRESLDAFVKAIASGMETEVCSLYLFEPTQQRLVLRATIGLGSRLGRQGFDAHQRGAGRAW